MQQAGAGATAPGALAGQATGAAGARSADTLVNAAAQAAGALTEGLAPSQPPAPPAAMAETEPLRVNPFTAEAKAPGEASVFIPATKADPEKVVVQEADGLISLMVREGSLRQVVAMIAETQRLNIVFAGSADSMVTASFDRQPWQAVLDALLSASGHTWAVRDHIIFISSIENADFLPPGAEGRRVEIFELDFASAVDIDQTVKGLLSPGGQSWTLKSEINNNLKTKELVAVCDYPAHLARVRDYICQADQPPRQVYIETHILQVELEDDCHSGVNFENIISLSGADVTLKTVGLANGNASSAFFVEPDGVGLNGLIELLKTTTDAKTLASPKIHGISGQESHIQIGGQLGYRVTTTTQTSTMETVQFLDVGVVLRVTPRITRDGRVLMRIYPKVSTGQVDPETGLPSEETTEVQTDVLLSSGQGIVIGGLIQEVDNNFQSKIPLLGEIPYLGILFQRRQVTRSRQEIIVTLQPHVLPYEPVVQEQLDHEFMRSAQPLTQGAICSFPRPYEPRMPDVFDGKGAPFCPKKDRREDSSGDLMELPPVDRAFEEADNGAMLEYGESVLPLETLPPPVSDESAP
ncbi:MAG: type II and III secretion system protein [Pirellulales bacterium]|nr:type II and III secretion system protein [Pirellulales bacterium]